jgi:hypothetical protein
VICASGTSAAAAKGSAAPTAKVSAEAPAATRAAPRCARKAQLIAQMGGQRVFGMQRSGDLQGQRRRQPAVFIDAGQSAQFFGRVGGHFGLFAVGVRRFRYRPDC